VVVLVVVVVLVLVVVVFQQVRVAEVTHQGPFWSEATKQRYLHRREGLHSFCTLQM